MQYMCLVQICNATHTTHMHTHTHTHTHTHRCAEATHMLYVCSACVLYVCMCMQYRCIL
eukprot:NODE_1256_length_573_cov_123.797710_g1181_i0.p5 GENE.NODE_1256_length_573_cov_123.797710_g1181_i0~~NODE_1256_length_573_cov_123.797710_g1181_i0.p5  ORF type:complete len:59 (-),score=15.82 NODE_1256_length_573_cov_123.797710_g1181_i0:77-253(-)